MFNHRPQRDDILAQLQRDAAKLGGLPPEELAELADLAAAISSLPDERPSEEQLERGRGRLMAALDRRPGLTWGHGAPILRAAAVLAGAAILGLVALGGAWAAGARLPQPVALGPLAPLAEERVQIARDHQGQEAADVARSGGGPAHGQQVRQEALDNPGRSGPTSNQDNVELVGIVQQQAQGRLAVNGITVLLTASSQITGPLTVGATVKVEGIVQADGSIVAREIEVWVRPGGIATPPAAVPPALGEVQLRGTIQSLVSGGFVLAGRTVSVTHSTQIEGQLAVGKAVKVEGTLQADGSILARQVKVEGAGEDRPSPRSVPTPPAQDDDQPGRRRG